MGRATALFSGKLVTMAKSGSTQLFDGASLRMELLMDDNRARLLLGDERARIQVLLDDLRGAGRADREATSEQGDMSDPSESLVAEGTDDAIAVGLAQRLATIERAEQRLAEGSYGRSVHSGDVIPDERLEADPAAELTVDEALFST